LRKVALNTILIIPFGTVETALIAIILKKTLVTLFPHEWIAFIFFNNADLIMLNHELMATRENIQNEMHNAGGLHLRDLVNTNATRRN
jgi:hypothetical protein